MENLKQKSYNEGVKSLASDIIEECISYGSDLNDIIHESVDGDSWIIYTFYYDQIMRFSANDDAYLDVYNPEDLGNLIIDKGLDGVNQARAFFALESDVRHAIYNMKDDLEEQLENLQDELNDSNILTKDDDYIRAVGEKFDNLEKLLGDI